ncbi:MAG TPA: molybdopterin cofactor-binding domain-containing protein, partial [Xanthobacteraceae bacterium]|nr:molybdopterin cofactor-binding domain-containing protein [Xanthobacteraceae bacterium]
MGENVRLDRINVSVSRRQVMIGAAGLSFAIALGSHADAATAASEVAGKAVNPWLSIAPDGTITIMSAATEMGQGSMTSLPLVLAEELDADWSKVRIVPAPVIDKIYGNPAYFYMMYTAGSNAVHVYFTPMRTFGAQARRVLLDNAAKKFGVPIEELTTEPSVVVHSKSDRRLSYGEIAAFAEIPEKAPDIAKEQLKKPSEFRLIGKDVMRVELPTKVNGSAQYSIDVQLPGMLYGAIVRAPVEGSVPADFDKVKVGAIAGVVKTVKLSYGIGVVAETPWAAFAARDIIADTGSWTKTGKAWGFDSDKGHEAFAATARDLGKQGTDWFKKGDLRGELAKA